MIRTALSAVIVPCIIGGCATTSSHGPSAVSSVVTPTPGSYAVLQHTVRPGETLWSIAKSYGVDVEDLVRANHLRDSSTVSAGQVLKIRHPEKNRIRAVEPPKKNRTYPRYYGKGGTFVWPVDGAIIYAFGSKVDKVNNKGIDIRAPEGFNVRASRAGRVVYCDSQLKGFGKTVIIDHGDNYQTIYSYNSEILVNVGDEVSQNDVIARAGKTGRAKESSLHFEIRKDGRPQNPTHYLSH